jgi:phosphate transport system substrate-binding protein
VKHPYPYFTHTIMNRTLVTLNALALGAFLAGCSSGESQSAVTPAADTAATRDADIRAVLSMQRRGEITETQAIRLIGALRGMPVEDAASAPRAVGTTDTAAVAPAPVIAVASVASPAAMSSKDGYKPGAEVTGRLRSTGSDSMDRIMADWAKGFAAYHPKLRLSHEGKGSSTAVPALLEGRADVGPMSRPLKREEIAQFEQKFGYAPTQIRTAVDALAVYVHPANPILKAGLTLKQIDAVFSASRKRGGTAVVTWGDLGLTGDWKGALVRVISRNNASGTYGFFRDEVLSKGDFREDAKFLPGSAEVVAAVGADKFAIGYSGIGYKTAAVAAVNIAADDKSGYKEPSEANAVTGEYPIARGLFVTINRKPGEPASDLHREFVNYILSPDGQDAVKREGYFAVPTKEVSLELLKLRYNAQ